MWSGCIWLCLVGVRLRVVPDDTYHSAPRRNKTITAHSTILLLKKSLQIAAIGHHENGPRRRQGSVVLALCGSFSKLQCAIITNE